jgi:small conductance mechanosensitive channel
MAEDEQWHSSFIKPIQYQTMLRFDESQMTVRASGKVKPGKQWAIASEFRIRIKQAFDKNDIEIPLPQRVVRQISEDAGKASRRRKK